MTLSLEPHVQIQKTVNQQGGVATVNPQDAPATISGSGRICASISEATLGVHCKSRVGQLEFTESKIEDTIMGNRYLYHCLRKGYCLYEALATKKKVLAGHISPAYNP